MFSGDLLFTTNSAPLLRRHKELLALNCIQTSTPKKVITEEDVIASNKAGFGSKIGSITNKITAITSLMSNYSHDSQEYKTLKYRTQCGQALQQREIDKSKGILPIPMPKEWHDYHSNIIKDDDSDEIKAKKSLNMSICAHKEPYFFIYNYDSKRIEYQKFIDEANSKAISLYGMTLEEMRHKDNLDENMLNFLSYFDMKCKIDMSPSTMNRICWKIEREFATNFSCEDVQFDYSIYKSNLDEKSFAYSEIKDACEEYLQDLRVLNCSKITNEDDRTALLADKNRMLDELVERITTVCPNEEAMCNILLDICYGGKMSKSIVWDVCGDQIIKNMLSKHNCVLTYPEKSEDGDFYCCGNRFSEKTIQIRGDDNEI